MHVDFFSSCGIDREDWDRIWKVWGRSSLKTEYGLNGMNADGGYMEIGRYEGNVSWLKFGGKENI